MENKEAQLSRNLSPVNVWSLALSWIVDMSSIGAAIGYGYTSAAAYRFAKKEKNTDVMVTGILGTLMACVFAVLVPIPSLHCSLGKESYICPVIWIVLGVIFYVSTRMKRKGCTPAFIQQPASELLRSRLFDISAKKELTCERSFAIIRMRPIGRSTGGIPWQKTQKRES